MKPCPCCCARAESLHAPDPVLPLLLQVNLAPLTHTSSLFPTYLETFFLKKRKKQQLSAQTFVMVLDFIEFPTCFDFDHFPTVSWILFFLHDFSHLSCNCFLLCFGNCLSLCVFLCLDFLSLSSLWLPDDVLSSSAWHPSFVTVSLTLIWSNLVSFYNQLSVYIKSYVDHLYPPNVFQRLQRLYPTILENICYSSQKKVAINLHLDQMRFVVINKLQV